MRKTILLLAFATGASIAASGSAQDIPPPAGQNTPIMPDRTPDRGPDRDRVVTRAEVIAQADARFAQIDTDHDGRISAGEMQAYRSAMRDRMIARGGDGPPPRPAGEMGHDGMGHGGMGHGGMGGRGMERDGASMTREAYEARAAERFDRMDANHDGRLDPTERANAAEMRRVDRREHREGSAPVPAPVPTP